MATLLTDTLETGSLSATWTGQSTTVPQVTTGAKYKGTYGMRIVNGAGAQWTRYMHATTGAATTAFRCYMYIESAEVSTTNGVMEFVNGPQTDYASLLMTTSGGGAVTLFPRFSIGGANVDGTASGTIPQDTWIRIEIKVDTSAAAAKFTWGWATGDGALTTVATDWTGGNAWGAGDNIYWWFLGHQSLAATELYFDDVEFTDTGAAYPLGATATEGQTLLPDADLVTTGWTTAPLFSKLNDSSDATIITATAS